MVLKHRALIPIQTHSKTHLVQLQHKQTETLTQQYTEIHIILITHLKWLISVPHSIKKKTSTKPAQLIIPEFKALPQLTVPCNITTVSTASQPHKFQRRLPTFVSLAVVWSNSSSYNSYRCNSVISSTCITNNSIATPVAKPGMERM